MLSPMTVFAIALCYISLLFFVAWWGERWVDRYQGRIGPWVYALSIGVYCSSWSFLGTVGQASREPWAFLPIYLGPILLFTLGFGFLRKLVLVSKAQSITSVADFIAARYGKSQLLAVLVTAIATLGLMPYMALQLKAMVFSLNLFSDTPLVQGDTLALIITLILALFAILFGTRKLDATEHNPGMILAVAFESFVKLLAFILVGLVVIFGLFDGPKAIFDQARALPEAPSLVLDLAELGPEMLIAMAAFVCLPRIFHVLVVECDQASNVNRARWLFPLYLLLLGLFVVPLALAGRVMLGDSVAADTYVISLPLMADLPGVALIAVLGTLSAATSMVIVAVVTVAIMISNECLVPLQLKGGRIRGKSFNEFSVGLLNARRVAIMMLMLAGFTTYLLLDDSDSLARIGMLAFGAFAQLAPALVGALYWKAAHRNGVLLGLLLGFGGWCHVVARPLFELQGLPMPLQDDMNHMVLALMANVAGFVLGSWMSRLSVTDRIQAAAFMQVPGQSSPTRGGSINQQDLLLLASRFVGPSRAYASFARFFPDAVMQSGGAKTAPPALVDHTERLIASVLGASSASVVMDSVMRGRDLGLEEIFSLVDEASTKVLRSQDQLRGAIEHAYEGISVVDADLNLVAWNQRYEELFHYPEGFLSAGLPVSDIIRYNAEMGRCGPGTVAEHVEKRLKFMREGSAHVSEREREDGRVIAIRGNPMPGGGFVMTFSDITDFRRQQAQLKEYSETLEARVAERTRELGQLNAQLLEATAAEERANQSKSRFLAAVGHDLMQPLNAARLFTASLLQSQFLAGSERDTVANIADSLKSAGELLTDLLDISKLETGTMEVSCRAVNLASVLGPMMVEFEAMASQKGLRFRHRLPDLTVQTDPALLRRLVQNFLTNALRYTDSGKLLIGCRRRGNRVAIEVWDTGCGIAESQVQEIFQEFHQLSGDGPAPEGHVGLGLGLAIAERIARVLEHPLQVASTLGKGSMFSVTVPLANERVAASSTATATPSQPLRGVRVLCIDNDESILAGLESLLLRWQCEVVTAKDLADARIRLGLKGFAPDIVLADYHLDDGQSGLDALDGIRALYGDHLPGILITADTRKALVEEVESRGYRYMAKMVRPAALRAMISASLKPRVGKSLGAATNH